MIIYKYNIYIYMYVCIVRIDENRVFQVLKFWPQECCNRHILRVFTSRPPGRRTGLTLAGKRIRKGCEVHQSGDYLNEVKMLQLCKSPYIVTLHGSLLTLIVKEVHPVSEATVSRFRQLQSWWLRVISWDLVTIGFEVTFKGLAD